MTKKKPKKPAAPSPDLATTAITAPPAHDFPLAGVEGDHDLEPVPPELLREMRAAARMKKGAGRPLVMFSEAKVRRLLWALKSAASIRACVEWSGFGWATYRRWFTEGKKDDASALAREFRASCARAREAGELALVRIVELHAPRDWRAAAALLEWKKPKRYGKQVAAKVQHTGDVTVKGLGEAFADFFEDTEKKGTAGNG